MKEVSQLDASSILLDCAHNTDGMNVLIDSLVHEFPNKVLVPSDITTTCDSELKI